MVTATPSVPGARPRVPAEFTARSVGACVQVTEDFPSAAAQDVEAPESETKSTTANRVGTFIVCSPPMVGGEILLQASRRRLHQFVVGERLPGLPRPVVVAEVDALAQRRVRRAPELVQLCRAAGCRGSPAAARTKAVAQEWLSRVISRPKTVRLVLGVTGEGEDPRREHEDHQAEQQADRAAPRRRRRARRTRSAAPWRAISAPAVRWIDPQADEDQHRPQPEQLRHVAEHVVPHLVPHHQQHLRVVELGEAWCPTARSAWCPGSR